MPKSWRQRHRQSCRRKKKFSKANAEAEGARLTRKGNGLCVAYRCTNCGRWHVGHEVRSERAKMAKQSLAAEKGALAEVGLKLPAVFQAPVQPVQARFIAPYISFAHPKRADEWAKLAARFGTVTEGGMYFISRDRLEQLDVAKLGMICCKQYWGESNAAGELQRTSWEEREKPFKEHVEAVVLVYLADSVKVANIQFRSTKCPAAKILADTLIAAEGPEWAKLSASHEATMVCQQPFMRFYGEVQLAAPRTSKTSGMVYRSTTCAVKPTGIAEWKLLTELCSDPGSQQLLEAAAKRFEERMAEVAKKLIP